MLDRCSLDGSRVGAVLVLAGGTGAQEATEFGPQVYNVHDVLLVLLADVKHW